VLRRGPRDFHNCARLTGDLIFENHVDDHHVFPQDYLRKNMREVAPRLRDSVLNRTLIDRKTNIRISNRAPSQYLNEIRNALGAQGFEELLESHLLPGGQDSPILRDEFEAFLNWRQKAISREIQSVTEGRD
jgi:hypothetical protein